MKKNYFDNVRLELAIERIIEKAEEDAKNLPYNDTIIGNVGIININGECFQFSVELMKLNLEEAF